MKYMSAVSGMFGVDESFVKKKAEQQAAMQRALGPLQRCLQGIVGLAALCITHARVLPVQTNK